MIEQEKTFKQKVNEFLCKYAQSDYVDEYGNTLKKPDGRAYKSGKVTVWDIFITFIFYPFAILFLISIIISFIGSIIGNYLLGYIGVVIKIHWIIDSLISGLIVIIGIILLITILILLHAILTKEVAKCPLTEIPPERKKCLSCGAPLSYENEEIRVRIKNEKSDRIDLGKCEICKSPKIYEGEGYSIYIKGYFKPKIEEKRE